MSSMSVGMRSALLALVICVLWTGCRGTETEQSVEVGAQELMGAPKISGFTPSRGPQGTMVAVTGSNFAPDTAVSFNGTASTQVVVESARKLSAAVPTRATSGPIRLSHAGGSATSGSAFGVQAAIFGVSPVEAFPGDRVRVRGSGFTGTRAVQLGTIGCGYQLVDDATLDVVVPSGAVTGNLRVTKPEGTALSAQELVVLPVITSFSPLRGPVGAVVRLTGSGFTRVSAVRLGKLSAVFTLLDDHQLDSTVPASAISAKWGVTAPTSSARSAESFEVVIDRCAGVVCRSRDACHVAGSCDPLTGACSNPAAADGTVCDDGNECTLGDACGAGSCTGREPVVCGRRDGCHVPGSCDPATGACSAPAASDGTACDDDDPCTRTDACVAGACTGSDLVQCEGAGPCRAGGSCDPRTGRCEGSPAPDGTACDDAEASTQGDACTDGVCAGEPAPGGEIASAPVAAGDSVTTDGGGDGATVRDPFEATVTSPVAGYVSIEEVDVNTVAPEGFTLLPLEAALEAPVTVPGMPLRLSFAIDRSMLPAAVTASKLQVFRNGVLVPQCTGAEGVAAPDPCVSERSQVGDDVVIEVLTSHASEWSFGYLTAMVNGQLATGRNHSCSIREGGKVYCWGSDGNGQLGDGGVGVDSSTPVQVSGITDAVELSAGNDHACALRANQTIWCWGSGTQGQLGNGGGVDSAVPVQVSGITDALHVSAGGSHTCAVRAGQSVACWGYNFYGQLGNGSTVSSLVPVAVGGLTGAVQVAGGGDHSCAVLSGGTVKCWGRGTTGQLGDGTNSNSLTPLQVSGLTNASAVTAGARHSCALRVSGSVACWGSGTQGQLGNDGTANALTPVAVIAPGGQSLADAEQVSAGNQHTCALRADGTATCWGDGSSGQLGNGAMTRATRGVAVSGLSVGRQVAAGVARSCALRLDGTVGCWGNGGSGLPLTGSTANALGTGSTANAKVPVVVSGLADAVQATAGTSHTCVLRSDKTLGCWGDGSSGQLGDGTTTAKVATPVVVSGVADATEVTAGSQHACALRAGGAVACWGNGGSGQLGNGGTSNATTPVTVSGLADATQVAAGSSHTCARRTGGGVACWGARSSGQLGDGSTTPATATTPVTVSGLTDATQVAAGASHTCALRTGGGVACWGARSSGQLGDGATMPATATTPVAVSGLSNAIQLTAGATHTCALLADGTAKCWGGNGNGQLGNGTVLNALTPVTVSGLSGAVQLVAGEQHTCAVLATGSVQCWGYGLFGQLGDGSTLSHSTPVGVSGLTDAVQVAAGGQHSCALRAGGLMACWGAGDYGQRGDNYPTANAPHSVYGIPPFGACDDGDVCNGLEAFDVYGACTAGVPLSVDDDANPCTVDSCDAVIGVQHLPGADGGACDDGDLCTQTDQCVSGSCQGSDPFDCDDSNPCTYDVCDPALGCLSQSNTEVCDDGDPCTVNDRCLGGSCTDADAKDCSAQSDQCNVGVCNALTGSCQPSPSNEGGACDDLSSCTAADLCLSGACVGSVSACGVHAMACVQGTPNLCTCQPGYIDGGAGVCVTDPNECYSNPCSASASCFDPSSTPGDVLCTCNPGYSGDGYTCTDIDECAGNPCGDGRGTCTEGPPGTYDCACNVGYTEVDGTCACDLNGTYGMRMQIALSWSNIDGIENGTAVVYSWAISNHSYDANGSLEVETIPCGGTSPDLCGTGIFTISPEAYTDYVTNQTWGRPSVPSELVSMSLPDALPGQAFTTPPTATLLGIHLADPLGPWPTANQNVGSGPGSPGTNGSYWLDHDADGQAAVTLYAVPPGGIQDDGAIPDPPVDYGATSSACGGLPRAWPPGVEGLTVRRIKRIYAASRSISELSGTIESCDLITGDVLGPGTSGQMQSDLRVYGCTRCSSGQAGTCADAACSPTLTDFFDDQPPAQQVDDATVRIERLDLSGAADDVEACEMVRKAMCFSEPPGTCN